MSFHGYGQYSQQQSRAIFTNHSFSMIDNILSKLDENKIYIGSTDFLKAIDNDSFFNLWKELWNNNVDIKRQGDFLQLVAAATSEPHPQIYYSTQAFIVKVLQSGLIQKIVSKQIAVMIRDPNKQNEQYAKIVHHLTEISIAGFRFAPTEMGDINIICVDNILKNMEHVNFLTLETKLLLEQLKTQYLEFQKMQEEESSNQHTQQQSHFQISSFTVSKEKPTDDFRKLSIIPLPEELAPNYKPFIRSAIVEGRYPSDNDYLDVQFRLMKEDLVHKFRQGIAIHETDNTDIYVYRDVRLDPPTLHYSSGDNIHYANIKISKQTLNNKTMKYKSLLCLSSDNFKKDFLFAIVIDRDEKHLKEGKIGIKFEGNKFEVDVKGEYSMVESSAFFEAYRHVLTTLQSFKCDKPIPFSKYLVKLNTKIEKPAYLKNVNYFDFSPVLTESAKRRLVSTILHPTQISNFNCDDFGMNESQFDAFKFALSSDLAVLQGPPGTGKSYIGSAIAKFLLNDTNWGTWNPDPSDERPLLVVCYTNHALDQFLTHIAGFVNGEDIVRVGSRCKDPLIQQFMLHNKRHERSEAKISYNDLQNQINPLLQNISKNLEYLIQLETRLASNNALCSSENYGRYANNILFSKLSSDEEVVAWLTTHKRSETEYPYDVALIRQLVEWNVPEIKAKNIYADACRNQREIDVTNLFHELKSPKYKNLPSHLNDENSKCWPKHEHINELIQLGYPEELAIEMLASVKNNIEGIRMEHDFMTVQLANTDLVEIYKAKLKLIQDFLNPKSVKTDTEEPDNIDNSKDENEEEEENSYGEWQIPENLKPYCHIILQAKPMTENEAYNECDIWKLSLLSRWRLYQFWIAEAQKARKREIADTEGKYRHFKKLLDEQKTIVDCEVIKRAKVIGMTTTGAAKYQSTLRSIKPRIVIAEEAAEVFEAHIVTSLTEACEHLILIGDHKQLRPNPAVYDLAKKCHLDISLFERLIKNKFPYKMLNYQRRMRPEISMLMKNHFYENLHDHENVKIYPHVLGVTKDLFFINHKKSETTSKLDGSHKNEYEINYALKLAKYFLQQGYEMNQITILCPYSNQSIAIQNERKKILGEDNAIRIDTVDNYQGEESDIIILSLVRSNNYDGKIGFLKISNRKCVALSRAKIGLYVIGNMVFIASAEKNKYGHVKEHQSWESIVKSTNKNGNISDTFIVKCQMHGKIQEIRTPNDFDTKCIEGGCQQKCNRDLKCRHKCTRYCHGDDMDHAKTICHQPCQKLCPFKHECKKECWEECGPCEVKVKKILDCGHEAVLPCHVESKECEKPCDRLLACDHQCPKKCHEKCPTICEVMITAKLGCGKHRGQKKCSEDPLTVKCMQPVKKQWILCGHSADTFCYVNPEVEPCPHPCNETLQDCGHLCQGTCGSCLRGLLHKPCGFICDKLLFCGHKCQAKCYEACPPCERYCRTACGHTCCSAANVKGKKEGKVRFLNNFNEEENVNGRKCGKACPPCMKDCLITCNHSKCTMKCGEDCNIELCTKPCGKPLPCSKKSKGKILELHPCVGICGENKCLPICPLCDDNKLRKIMKESPLNKDNEENVINTSKAFIQLDDCKHIFEVIAFDDYVKKSVNYSSSKPIEIAKLKCPKCEKPIFTSHRYNSYINKQAAEIENIKQLLREYNDDKNKQHKFVREATDILTTLNDIAFTDATLLSTFEEALNILPSKVTQTWLLSAKNCLRILSHLTSYASEIDEANFSLLSNGCTIVLEECQIHDCHMFSKQKFNAIFERCANIPTSNELFEQLLSETKRFGFIVDLFLYLLQFSNNIAESMDHDDLKALIKSVTSKEKFNDEHEAWDMFESLRSQYAFNYHSIITTRIVLDKVPQYNKWFKKGDSYYCT